VLATRSDDLGRTEPDSGGPAGTGPSDGRKQFPDEPPLVDVPPPGRPPA
jgi:hypothetical protein